MKGEEIAKTMIQVYLFPVFPPVHCRALNINHRIDFIGVSLFFTNPAKGAKGGPEKVESSTKSSTEVFTTFVK